MDEGLLSLKWNNHKTTFCFNLSQLRENHTYTDVTLACDGLLYPAHKFVLSSCSEYFNDIFKTTTGSSVVIILKDVRKQDLVYLLDYMYLGEVNVAQSQLTSLIKTAECLKVKGLAIPDDDPYTKHAAEKKSATDHREREKSPPSKRKRHEEEDRHASQASSIRTSATPSPLSRLSYSPSRSDVDNQMQPPISVSLPHTSKPTSSVMHGANQRLHLTHSGILNQHTKTTTSSASHSTSSSTSTAVASALVETPQIKEEPVESTDNGQDSFINDSYEDVKPTMCDELMTAGPSGLNLSDTWESETGPDCIDEHGDLDGQGISKKNIKYIVFEEEKRSTAICSSRWIRIEDGVKKIYWPPSNLNVKKLLKEHAVPDERWTLCSNTKILETFDTYGDACNYMEKYLSESTSDNGTGTSTQEDSTYIDLDSRSFFHAIEDSRSLPRPSSIDQIDCETQSGNEDKDKNMMSKILWELKELRKEGQETSRQVTEIKQMLQQDKVSKLKIEEISMSRYFLKSPDDIKNLESNPEVVVMIEKFLSNVSEFTLREYVNTVFSNLASVKVWEEFCFVGDKLSHKSKIKESFLYRYILRSAMQYFNGVGGRPVFNLKEFNSNISRYIRTSPFRKGGSKYTQPGQQFSQILEKLEKESTQS